MQTRFCIYGIYKKNDNLEAIAEKKLTFYLFEIINVN